MRYLAILGVLAACTDANPDQTDVPIPAQTLCGHATPTTADDYVWVRGRVVAVTEDTHAPTGVADLAVERLPGWDSVAQTQAFSDDDFQMSVQAGGVPVDAVIVAEMNLPSMPTAASFAPTYYFSTVPWAADLTLPTPLWLMDWNAYTKRAGATSYETGMVIVSMRDCAGMPLKGASISVGRDSKVQYYDLNGTLKPSADATTYGAMVTNVAAGDITISSHGAQLLRTAHAKVYGNAVTMVDLYPQ